MSILCGIDFSPASLRAAELAGRMAQARHVPLELAHVVDHPADEAWERVKEPMLSAARFALQREVERLRERGVRVEGHLLEGKADEALIELASKVKPLALVLSAVGSRSQEACRVGGIADRVARTATCPVLVLRDPDAFHEWLDEKRPLRVVVGADRSRESSAALDYVRLLRSMGPVDVHALRVYWAAEEFRRLGFHGVRSIVDPDPRVERVLLEELDQDLGELPGNGRRELHVELALGRASERIVSFATERAADLIVVGSHRRNLLERLWNGSTSRTVLHQARCSVACVTAAADRSAKSVPNLRSVLVATDLSETGNAAVRWAYALVPQGGIVHLVHVHPGASRTALEHHDVFRHDVDPAQPGEHRSMERQLWALEPEDLARRGIESVVHLLESTRPAEAIIQAAERLGVDAIVLGTRGRSGLVRAALGSVAQEVSVTSPRPVLLVHAPA